VTEVSSDASHEVGDIQGVEPVRGEFCESAADPDGFDKGKQAKIVHTPDRFGPLAFVKITVG
jgi:hypothetical protein